jgi:putative ABC transport system permease protein
VDRGGVDRRIFGVPFGARTPARLRGVQGDRRAHTRSILAGLALQAVVVALLAAALGVALSQLLAPLFPMTVVVPIRAYLALPVIAIVIGLLASVAGLRRAVAVDPALAFGGP